MTGNVATDTERTVETWWNHCDLQQSSFPVLFALDARILAKMESAQKAQTFPNKTER